MNFVKARRIRNGMFCFSILCYAIGCVSLPVNSKEFANPNQNTPKVLVSKLHKVLK